MNSPLLLKLLMPCHGLVSSWRTGSLMCCVIVYDGYLIWINSWFMALAYLMENILYISLYLTYLSCQYDSFLSSSLLLRSWWGGQALVRPSQCVRRGVTRDPTCWRTGPVPGRSVAEISRLSLIVNSDTLGCTCTFTCLFFWAIMSLWKCKLKSLYVLPQESPTSGSGSGSGSCSSQDTDISLPGALNSSNTAPSKGNYNRSGILYHGMSGHAAVSQSSQ